MEIKIFQLCIIGRCAVFSVTDGTHHVCICGICTRFATCLNLIVVCLLLAYANKVEKYHKINTDVPQSPI